MTHVELEIPDDIASKLRERAEKLGMSIPGYVAEIVRREVVAGWPPRFFQEVVGGWKGTPLERPPQGELEARDELQVYLLDANACIRILNKSSTARAHDLTLVSHNISEFSRVPGLRVEDWEALAAPDITG